MVLGLEWDSTLECQKDNRKKVRELLEPLELGNPEHRPKAGERNVSFKDSISWDGMVFRGREPS